MRGRDRDRFNGGLALPLKSLIFLLDSCTSVKKALQIQTHLLVTGLHRQRIFISKLISFFSLRSSYLHHSLLIFHHLLRRPNIFIYNTLIRSLPPPLSLSLYKLLLSRRPNAPSPNRFTFPFLLSSCSRIPLPSSPGLQFHSHLLKLGFSSDPHVTNSLISFYSASMQFPLACRLFDEITHPDTAAFNAMITAFTRAGRSSDGVRLFNRMAASGVKPDACTFICLLSLCSVTGDGRLARAVHVLALKCFRSDGIGDRVKGAVVRMYAKVGVMGMAERVLGTMGAAKGVKVWSCMVSGYAGCGEIETARRVFDEMPERDLISWTSMISGYCRNGRYKEAVEVYRDMESDGVKPDEVTLCAVLSACAHLGDLDLGRRIHRCVEDCLLDSDSSMLRTAIVDMYAKCGCIGIAQDVFNRVDRSLRTTTLVNSILGGLGQHGLGKRAVAIYREMEGLGLSPDEVTFVVALSACSRSGLTEEGNEILDMMDKKYGVQPQIEHYSYMVDLLGRGGYLDEAYDLIKNMPITPEPMIWSALLRAFRVHGNRKIGEVAARNLLQLSSSEPNPKGNCFRLAELFVDVTTRENAKKVRKMMNYRPVHKQ